MPPKIDNKVRKKLKVTSSSNSNAKSNSNNDDDDDDVDDDDDDEDGDDDDEYVDAIEVDDANNNIAIGALHSGFRRRVSVTAVAFSQIYCVCRRSN